MPCTKNIITSPKDRPKCLPETPAALIVVSAHHVVMGKAA
jgi:hypothetical protein